MYEFYQSGISGGVHSKAELASSKTVFKDKPSGEVSNTGIFGKNKIAFTGSVTAISLKSVDLPVPLGPIADPVIPSDL